MILLFTVLVKGQEKVDIVPELIYSKQLDESTTVECFTYSDGMYYYWEFKLKGTESRTIDKFRLSKQNLSSYNSLERKAFLYINILIIDVLRDSQNNLIFYLDKFGQIDIHKYTPNNTKEIIRIQNYSPWPMESIFLVQTFEDVKLFRNTIYSISKLPMRNTNKYILSKTDLREDISYIADIEPFSDFTHDCNDEFDVSKVILTMDSAEYKYNGYGYRFFITSDDKVKVLDFDSTQAVYKLNFELSKLDEKNVNDLIEWDSSLF